jgi:hypothetical protein
MSQIEFVDRIGGKDIVANVQDALARARKILTDFSGPGEKVASDLEHACL